jgi:hypothetical protein
MSQKDTEERRSRIERSRPILVTGAGLVVLGVVAFFVVSPWLGLVLIGFGLVTLFVWLKFPYLHGEFEFTLGGKGFRVGYRGRLTDPQRGVREADEKPSGAPERPARPVIVRASRPRRLRRLLRWRPRNRGSAGD